MYPGNDLKHLCAGTVAAMVILTQPVFAQGSVPVSVKPLSEVMVDLERSAPAEVRALNHAVLAAEVSARISNVHVDVGSEVSKGDLLVELDDRDYRLALQQAEAALATSKAQKAQADIRLQRARQLIEGNYLSADDLLARETDAQVANAQILLQESAVAVARHNLDKCRIVAPYNGTVSERTAQVGGFVVNASPLLRLAETDRIVLDARIPEEIAASVTRTDRVEFLSRNEKWPVKLLQLSSLIDRESRGQDARFLFTGSDIPAVGRSGEVIWRTTGGLIPANLLVRRNGVLGIFLANSGKAEFRALPQAQEGRPVTIDLPPETRIVVTGRDRLQDGDSISTP